MVHYCSDLWQQYYQAQMSKRSGRGIVQLDRQEVTSPWCCWPTMISSSALSQLSFVLGRWSLWAGTPLVRSDSDSICMDVCRNQERHLFYVWYFCSLYQWVWIWAEAVSGRLVLQKWAAFGWLFSLLVFEIFLFLFFQFYWPLIIFCLLILNY